MKKLDQLLGELLRLRGKPTLVLSAKKIERLLPFDVAKALDGFQLDELDVVFLSSGGNIEGAYNVIRVLRGHAQRLNVLVPFYAKSAGTLVCLAADSVVTSTLSEFGPLDAQVFGRKERRMKSALTSFYAGERVRKSMAEQTQASFHKMLRIEESIVDDERQLMIGVRYAERVLLEMMKWDEVRAIALARRLVFDYPSHDHVIDREEALSLGMPIVMAPPELERVLHALALELHSREETFVQMHPALSVLPLVPAENAKSAHGERIV